MPVHDTDQAVFIVWMNPEHVSRPQTRLLVTHVSQRTGLPIAFLVRNLKNSSLFSTLPIQTHATIAKDLFAATARTPVLIPTDIAAEQLGWDEYTLSKDTFGA